MVGHEHSTFVYVCLVFLGHRRLIGDWGSLRNELVIIAGHLSTPDHAKGVGTIVERAIPGMLYRRRQLWVWLVQIAKKSTSSSIQRVTDVGCRHYNRCLTSGSDGLLKIFFSKQGLHGFFSNE